jgi:hypothetical protein
MKAVELIGVAVYDSDGAPVGAVRDLFFEAGGVAVLDSGRPAYRLRALECGPVGLAHRLGYGHRQITGPWPLPALMRRLVRDSVLVDWEQIATLGAARIDLAVRRDQLRRVGRRSRDRYRRLRVPHRLGALLRTVPAARLPDSAPPGTRLTVPVRAKSRNAPA